MNSPEDIWCSNRLDLGGAMSVTKTILQLKGKKNGVHLSGSLGGK
jgi:hypothetical protein